jgi:hypothetical protein
MHDLAQEADAPTMVHATEIVDDPTTALKLIEGCKLGPLIEQLHNEAHGPVEISRTLTRLHGVQISAVIIERWVSEEIRVREALRSNPLVRKWVEEHAEELTAAVGTDLRTLDSAVDYLRDIIKGNGDDLELMSPDERVKQRIKACREAAKVIQTKYELTGEPIVQRKRKGPAERMRVLALEVYGTEPPPSR